MIQLLEENIGENLYNIEFTNSFLAMRLKHRQPMWK